MCLGELVCGDDIGLGKITPFKEERRSARLGESVRETVAQIQLRRMARAEVGEGIDGEARMFDGHRFYRDSERLDQLLRPGHTGGLGELADAHHDLPIVHGTDTGIGSAKYPLHEIIRVRFFEKYRQQGGSIDGDFHFGTPSSS